MDGLDAAGERDSDLGPDSRVEFEFAAEAGGVGARDSDIGRCDSAQSRVCVDTDRRWVRECTM